MSVPTWETVQAAIQAWIVAGSGLAAARVRWADQGGAEPTDVPWISLSVIAEETRGRPWVDVETNPDAAPLADVIHTVRSSNTGTLSIQVFNAAAQGTSSPLQILKRIRMAAKLPSVSDALSVGGVGLGSFTGARNVGKIANAVYFEPRGVLECRFHTAAEIQETGPMIETVEIDGEVEA
jgi:hypothetical protein